MIWFAVILFALLGGWVSRMAGGGPPKLPWGLDQWIYALPYFVVALPALSLVSAFFGIGKKHRYFILLLPYLAAFAGKRSAHGNGLDYGTAEKAHELEIEKIEYLVYPLKNKIPEYWYDFIYMSVTGLVVTLIPALMLLFISVPAALLILVSGLLKGVAYMIGWAIYPRGHGRGIPHLNEATAIGEFLTGVFGWGAIAVVTAHFYGV